MALYFRLPDLLRATLPQGHGFVGMLGVDPVGSQYHVLSPVPLERAWDFLAQGAGGAGRQGWTYRMCRTYATPPPRQGTPTASAFRQARAAQALATGRELLAWAGLRGWSARVEESRP